ncbi:cyclic pyranopterin monophosphate synthase MoaC [bacterium]|nr:cyclic pyranopterin monophosphate synthase MoaC [bacterium]
MKKKLSHINLKGKASMVNVTSKKETFRTATAHARIAMNTIAFSQVMENRNKKGDVLSTANLAGIMAAKKTSGLIPLCHPLNLSHIELKFIPDDGSCSIEIIALCELSGKTGVEMEALTAVTVAALTLYDMCKAVDKRIEISEIYLIKKTGGRSGAYFRKTK